MPAINSTRLTKRRIDAIQSGETCWDSDVRGFCCRARTKRKLFYLKARTRGRQRWLTIGEYGAPWTVETARREAQRLLGELHNGADVETLRHGGDAGDPIMEDLCARFIEEHAKHHKKASSVYVDELNIRNHILPLIGKIAVKDITRSDMEAFKQAIRNGTTATKPKRGQKHERFGPAARGGPGAANRCLALLSKMFNLAELWGWRPEHSNPVRMVAKYKENQVQRFLSDEELQRLGQALADVDEEGEISPYVTAAIRLLLLTGARLNEILTLKWDYVDRRGGFLQLPTSKTGPKVIFLNEDAVAVLNGIDRRKGNPYVIVGSVDGKHLVNIQKPWRTIRKRADIDDVRIHDLRHSFASIAASNGASLPMIGQLLGHRSADVTQRYAHLTASTVRDINELVGSKLSASITVDKQEPREKRQTDFEASRRDL